MLPLIRPVFKKSWSIVWNNPVLWLFGFFAAIFSSNEINIIITNFNRINNWIDNLITFKVLKVQFEQFFSSFQARELFTSTALYNISLGLIIFLLFIYLSIVSQIFLTCSIPKLYKIKKRFNLVKIWKKGQKNFWQILILYILTLLITYGFLYFLSFKFLYTFSVPIIVYIIVYLVLVFFVSFISRFTLFYIVIKNKRFIDAVWNAILFFLNNFLFIIKTAIALFIILISIGLVFLLVTLGASFPLIAIVSFFLYIKFIFGFWIILMLWTFLLFVLFIVFSALFSTFQLSTWVVLFLGLEKK